MERVRYLHREELGVVDPLGLSKVSGEVKLLVSVAALGRWFRKEGTDVREMLQRLSTREFGCDKSCFE